jgi:hypothetical protein
MIKMLKRRIKSKFRLRDVQRIREFLVVMGNWEAGGAM